AGYPGGRLASEATGLSEQLAQDVGQDAAVAVVVELGRGVDAHARLELARAGLRARADAQRPAAREAGGDPLAQSYHVVVLAAAEAERARALAGRELERQDAHPHQVRAMDPLLAL